MENLIVYMLLLIKDVELKQLVEKLFENTKEVETS